jgi:hypothetical protein
VAMREGQGGGAYMPRLMKATSSSWEFTFTFLSFSVVTPM